MTWSTRVSTRSVLSPVSDFLGTTYGSMRTNIEREEAVVVAFERGAGGGVLEEAGDVVFVDVDADVELRGTAENDERLVGRSAHELTRAGR